MQDILKFKPKSMFLMYLEIRVKIWARKLKVYL